MDNNFGTGAIVEEKPRTLWITLAVLGLVLTGCCVVSIGAFFVFQPDPLSLVGTYFPSPTPIQTNTPVVTPTPNLTATEQVFQSTGTAEAIQILATDSVSQWPVLYADTFDSNKNKWPVADDNDDYADVSREITDGTYHWNITAKKGFIAWITADDKPISDFNVSVDITRTAGSTQFDYGLIFREDANSNFYYFGVDDKGFFVSLNKDNAWNDLIPVTDSSAILPGATNRLTVLAQGPHFAFYINDQLVGDATDEQLQKGTIGIAAEVHETGLETKFEFDNFELRGP